MKAVGYAIVRRKGVFDYRNAKIGKLLSIMMGITLLIAALSACSQGSNSSGSSTSTGPIKIGVSLPLSGDFSADGAATKQGYDLWVQTINSQGGLLGRQVQLDVLNNGSSVNQTGIDYKTLIGSHHDDLVVGPFADDYTVAAARSAARYGYAMINGSGVAPNVFTQGLTNLFSVSLSAKNTLRSFAAFVLSLPSSERPTTAAYATEDDPYLRPIVEDTKTALEQGGITTPISEIVYPPETTDWTPIADKIIAANPQIVVLGTATPDAVAFVNRFKQEHWNPKILVEVSGPDQGDQFTKPIGGTAVAEGIFVPNGGWFPAIQTFGNSDFQAAYIAKYGGTADGISGDSVQSYSVMQVLQQAVVKANSIDNAKLIQVLRSNVFNTVQGPVRFAADGENSVAVAFLFQWQKGNLIPVYPLDNAQSNPEFPKPQWH
jgi:branched-chain amino acid transport system substrate-binding protein